MTNLSSFSLLNSKVEKIKNEENITSGIAFMKLALKIILKLNEEEIEEAITDGPDDGELDAIHIEENTVHILTFKYTDQFELTKKNYPGKDIEQFCLSIELFISGRLSKRLINSAVYEKYLQTKNLSSKDIIDFKIYVVSNKFEPIKGSRDKLESIIDNFRITNKPLYIGQDILVTMLLNNRSLKIDGNIKFIDKQYFEKADSNIRSVIGVITAEDLINLIKSPNGKDVINENIFNENVRVYKPKHTINKEIIETAKSPSNYQFFYLNNGITMLCEEIDYIPNTRSPIVKMTNLQIINGGQTSHSLFEVYKSDPEKLNSIELLVRICIAKRDNIISSKISETTNSQIPVANRDLRSNDYIQRKLKLDFDTLGFFYETKANEYIDKPKEHVLNNELLGQLYLSYELGKPSEAKNKKTIVFGEVYQEIFNEDKISANELLRLYNIYKPLLELKRINQNKKRQKLRVFKKYEHVSWAIFHIIFGVKLIHQKSIDKINLSKKKTPQEKKAQINAFLNSDQKELIDISINEIYKILRPYRKNSGFTYDAFFKESSTNKIISDHFLNKY